MSYSKEEKTTYYKGTELCQMKILQLKSLQS